VLGGGQVIMQGVPEEDLMFRVIFQNTTTSVFVVRNEFLIYLS